jgi:plasmid stabilization system protein ParE
MDRVVQVFPQAELDLRRIGRSIRERVSTKSSVKWMGKLQKAIESLSTSADRYPEADEAFVLGRDLRMCIVGNRSHVYRIIFTIVENRVLIHCVRHAAQDQLTEDDL